MHDPAPLTRHDLYERCVQSPRHLVPLIRAIHGGDPRTLGEDFAGTAALSHCWADAAPDHRAIAVDLDPEALHYRPAHERVLKRHADVSSAADPCDALFVGNFSIGYHHARAALVAYLRHARARLTPGGVFLCDTYGGESAFITGHVHRDHWITDGPHKGKRIRYTWEQRDADALTGMVTDICHFRVDAAGLIEVDMPDAFIYRWRLWSVPELRDALAEAGFTATQVYDKAPDAVDGDGAVYMRPVAHGEELDSSFIVLVAGRV